MAVRTPLCLAGDSIGAGHEAISVVTGWNNQGFEAKYIVPRMDGATDQGERDKQ